MKTKLLNSGLLLVSLIIALAIVMKFQVIVELNSKMLDERTPPEVTEAAYNQFSDKLELNEVSNEELIEVIGSIKDADLSDYEYQVSLKQVLDAYEKLLIYLLLFNAFIAVSLWHSSVFPKNRD